MRCRLCGSYAINHHLYGRDGTNRDLCDGHYWKEKAERYHLTLEQIKRHMEISSPTGAEYSAVWNMTSKALLGGKDGTD